MNRTKCIPPDIDAQHQAADILVQALARPEIQALKAYSSARSLADDQGILLNANENPWPPAGVPIHTDSQEAALNRYPEPQPQALVARLAEIYQVSAQQLLLTRGSDEGIDLLVRAFCRAGKDAIAICPPCFGMYEIAAQIQAAAVERIPLKQERGFALDIQTLATSSAKLIFLCSPNNPTGNLIPKDDIVQLCRQHAQDAIVVVDEAYIEFSPNSTLINDLDQLPNLVILRTLSKAWALAGARLGVLIAAPAIIRLLRKILPPYPLPKPTVNTVLKALNPESQLAMQARVQQLNQQREQLSQSLLRLPCVKRIYPSAANFLLIHVSDANAIMAAAMAAGIVLRNQSSQVGLENCIRISIGTAEENSALIQCLQAMSAGLLSDTTDCINLTESNPGPTK